MVVRKTGCNPVSVFESSRTVVAIGVANVQTAAPCLLRYHMRDREKHGRLRPSKVEKCQPESAKQHPSPTKVSTQYNKMPHKHTRKTQNANE